MACQGHRQNNPFESGEKEEERGGEVGESKGSYFSGFALHPTQTRIKTDPVYRHTPLCLHALSQSSDAAASHLGTISNRGIIDQVAGSCQWPVACLTRPALPTSPRPPPSSLHSIEYKAEYKEVRSCRVYTHPSK